MKTQTHLYIFPLILAGSMLSSCVYRGHMVPEMPYKPTRPAPQLPPMPTVQPVQQPVAMPGVIAPVKPIHPTTVVAHPRPTPALPPVTTPKPQLPPVTAPAITPAPVVKPVVTPAPAPVQPAASSHITQSFTPPALTPAPVVTPAAAQPPVVNTVTPPAADEPDSAPTDPKLITNTGPIPVAMRVEGDPIRVYNPLDHTKTIRIIDPKTGKVHPSGKVLKVKGTNFKFIVP